jgi:hypothetical protein
MNMHDVPGTAGGVAGVVIAIAVAITTFWLGLAATVWKVFLEPSAKRSEAAHEESARQARADRERDQQECDRQLARLSDRIVALEALLYHHGPAPMRAAIQIQRSAEQLTGAADHEGDDVAGLHAHRIPPSGGAE